MKEVEDVLLDGSPAKSIVKIQRERGKKVFYCTFESTGARIYRCDKVSRDLLESYEKKQLEKEQSKQPKKRGRPAGSLRPAATVKSNQDSPELPSGRVESPNDPPVFGAGEGVSVSGAQGQVMQGKRRSQRLQNQARELDSRAEENFSFLLCLLQVVFSEKDVIESFAIFTIFVLINGRLMIAPRDSNAFAMAFLLLLLFSKPVPLIYPNGSCEVFLRLRVLSDDAISYIARDHLNATN